MAVVVESSLTIDELGRLLAEADPGALLIAPRTLRRIIKYDRKLTYLGLQVPHRKSYVIGREALLALFSRQELGILSERELPAALLLMSRPDPDKLAAADRGPILLQYWRLLFHARIHSGLAAKFASARFTAAALRRRIHQIGQTEFDEARSVLRQEKLLLPPHNDRTIYEEFAAVFLELSYFAALLLPRYFPAIEDFERIRRILAADADADACFAATRLTGAAEPVFSDKDAGPPPPAASTLIWTGSDKRYRALMKSADGASQTGNSVRAAIYRTQASQVAPPLLIAEAQEHAKADLTQIVERARKSLHLSAAQVDEWMRALPALLAQAATGIWPVEARLLYDLQKICIDYERPIYTPDFAEWIYSAGRLPLLRQLPNQPLVLAVKHLRRAVGRLASVRVKEADRQELSRLLHETLEQALTRLRDCFRPPIQQALTRVGLKPRDFPECLGRDKLVEELLDHIAERGFLNMSVLRDALARNQLKLPDLGGTREFFGGDPLIQANRELALGAAGVYRRGEIYLRWLQRGSALAFGTRIGRWLMLFLVLPFLAAFATIVFVEEIWHILDLLKNLVLGPGQTQLLARAIASQGVVASGTGAADWPQVLVTLKITTLDAFALRVKPHHLHAEPLAIATGILGIFFLLLMHWPGFRALVLRCSKLGWKCLRRILYDWPAALLQLPAIRDFLTSRPYLFMVRFVLKPLPVGGLAGLIFYYQGASLVEAIAGAGATLALVSLVLNSRLGRDLEEAVIDRTVRNLEFFQGLLPGLVRLVLDFFKAIIEGVDRFFYSVDEWLRFRGGQGRLALVVKTVLGLFWFLATYVVRLFINVFVEPTVNPIKHIPVVTVAAKLLFPFWPVLIPLFNSYFEFLGPVLKVIMGQVVLHSIPGAAGFLAWELKENWRLYGSNRPRNLQPQIIGHHGETMLRLLKPGVHSGTLPKLYARLRRAERKAYRGGTWKTPRRLRENLHHVADSVRQFAERELLAFVIESRGWQAGPIDLAAVEAGSNRIRLELVCPKLTPGYQHAAYHEIAMDPGAAKAAPENLEIYIEEQSGWLLARLARPGWLGRLSAAQIDVFCTALRGFYQKAGIDMVREQIEACFQPACPPYDIGDEGLIVWPGQGYDTEVLYNLSEAPLMLPRLKDGQIYDQLPVLSADKLLYRNQPVPWTAWVEAWRRDQSGLGSCQEALSGEGVLPRKNDDCPSFEF